MNANTIGLEVALIGLLGVLLGSAISTASNILIANRRERLEAFKESRDRAVQLKRATRLIADELSTAHAIVGTSIERKRWSPNKMKTEAWEKHKDILATELTDTEWLSISIAYTRIEFLSSQEFCGEIGPSSVEQLTPYYRDIECGCHTLTLREDAEGVH